MSQIVLTGKDPAAHKLAAVTERVAIGKRIMLTPHDVLIRRATERVQRLKTAVEAKRIEGDLGFFNAEFKRRPVGTELVPENYIGGLFRC